MSRLFVPTERRVDTRYYESVIQDAQGDDDDFLPIPIKVHWANLGKGVFTVPPIKIKNNPESNWDESTWPDESRIRGGFITINKTNAKKKYLLNDDDMKDLCYIDGEKHNPKYRPPQLFLEEQVLRRGWEKHGGPKGLKYAKAEQRKKRSEARAKVNANKEVTSPANKAKTSKTQTAPAERPSSPSPTLTLPPMVPLRASGFQRKSSPY